MNKRGGEKLLSVWWFFVIAVVGAGIIVGVLIFYSYENEAREIEADILAEKIVLCLSEQGELNENFLNEDFDIFKECELEKKILDSSDFYFSVILEDFSGKNIKEIGFGAKSFVEDCKTQEELRSAWQERTKYYPRCSEKRSYVINKQEKERLIVLAGSNQQGKKFQL